MTAIVLTPESVAPYALLNKPPRISISKAMITFNPTAVKKLALSIGSRFKLEVDDFKLYYRDSTADGDFEFSKEIKKNGVLNAYAAGVLSALVDNRVVEDFKTARFTLGEFKDGRRELVLIVKEKKKEDGGLKDRY